jgi:hypothetical protein
MFRAIPVLVACVAVIFDDAPSHTFVAQISIIQGNRVTYSKADAVTTTDAIGDVPVTLCNFDKTTGAIRPGAKKTPLQGGLASKLFKNLEDRKATTAALITIADDGANKGKITAIHVWQSAAPK